MTYLLVLMLLVGVALSWRVHFFIFAIATLVACMLALGISVAIGTSLAASIVTAIKVGIALQVGFVLRLVLQTLVR